jgi:RsiW-degrading membrane proteinase PrsW (M82 family)
VTRHGAETERKVTGSQRAKPETAEGGYLAEALGRTVVSGLRVLALLAFLGLAASAVSGSALFDLLRSEPTAAPLLGAVAAAALVPGALIAAYVRLSDPGGVPVSVLAAGFFLGMVVTFLAAALNGVAAERLRWLPVYAFPIIFYAFVGPIEEGLKALAVYLHPATDRRLNRAIEYAVVGAFVGLGFAFAENAFYLGTDVVLTQNADAIAETAVARASVGPLHVVLTALAGYYTGKAALSSAGYGRSFLTAAKGLLAVAFLHGTYNTVVVQLAADDGLPAQGSVEAGVVGGKAAMPVFMILFFVVILCLLERAVREDTEKDAVRG